jgi:hypothetical protein
MPLRVNGGQQGVEGAMGQRGRVTECVEFPSDVAARIIIISSFPSAPVTVVVVAPRS